MFDLFFQVTGHRWKVELVLLVCLGFARKMKHLSKEVCKRRSNFIGL